MIDPSEDTRSDWFDKVLGALSSLPGMIAVLGVFLSACVAMIVISDRSWDPSSKLDALLETSELREGYVLLSEIEQLVVLMIDAERGGGIQKEQAILVDQTAWSIRERIKSLQDHETELPFSLDHAAVVSALRYLLTIIRDIQGEEFTNLGLRTDDLVAASGVSITYILLLLDGLHGETVGALQEKSAIMSHQHLVLKVFVGFLAVGGCGVLVLLRREFLERRALKIAKSRIQHLVFSDTLTDLPNRTQFKERLGQILDDRRQVGLMLVDVVAFKSINENFSHDAGDAVLCHLADCLKFFGETAGGFAARLGGDEFALVVPDDDLGHLHELAQSLLKAIETPFVFNREKIDLSACIGVATASQISKLTKAVPDLLTRVADFALHNAKQRGRGHYMVYDQVLEDRHRNRRAMLEELPLAIRTGHLLVYLQPKVALSSGKVLGFEALVRWDRNGHVLPPGDFISLAEESGLITMIDQYVLNRATKLVGHWNREHGTDFYVAVNLSAHHFTSNKIILGVEEALWNSGLPASQLVLEITETVETRDWTQASETVQGLKALGAKIAIDDFGTGFSSLAFIMAIGADELKIDRSLVDELETSQQARRLMESVADIASNLNLAVTVEGIETTLQSEIVVNLGATTGQGFLFGAARPAEQALLEATKADEPRQKAFDVISMPAKHQTNG
jgi:diguanylate cyclase (GGDEF)-like protein